MGSFKVTRLGPPRIRRDTIIVGGVVFTADDLANPTPAPIPLDDLTDVVIVTPAENDTLRYVGGQWINDTRRWEPVTFNFGTGPELVWDGDDLVMEWKEY